MIANRYATKRLTNGLISVNKDLALHNSNNTIRQIIDYLQRNKVDANRTYVHFIRHI